RMYAFFNSTPKETYQRTKGSASLDAGGPEVALALDESATQRRSEIAERLKESQAQLQHLLDDESSGLAAWERGTAAATKAEQARLPANIRKLLAVPAEKRNKNQQTQIRAFFISDHADAKKLQESLDAQ